MSLGSQQNWAHGRWRQGKLVRSPFLSSSPNVYVLEQYVCGLPRITQTRKEKCVIYSFGVERESSWEAEILETTDCEIWMYDFSVTEVRLLRKYVLAWPGLHADIPLLLHEYSMDLN
jgi:hypothetical protein